VSSAITFFFVSLIDENALCSTYTTSLVSGSQANTHCHLTFSALSPHNVFLWRGRQNWKKLSTADYENSNSSRVLTRLCRCRI